MPLFDSLYNFARWLARDETEAEDLVQEAFSKALRGFGSFRLPSGQPIAYLYIIIPLSGILIALFTVEQIVNGLLKGFDHPEPPAEDDHAIPAISTTIQPGAQP